jgi:hypothetical protein
MWPMLERRARFGVDDWEDCRPGIGRHGLIFDIAASDKIWLPKIILELNPLSNQS